MADAKARNFGRLIRERRRRLDLTQKEVARRIKTSGPYISHLELEIRHPSRQIVLKLSEALKLDPRDMFLLVNPGVNSIISEQQKSNATPAWNAFVKDAKARKIYKITDHEMENPLGGRENGRGPRPARLRLHPNHHSSGLGSITGCIRSVRANAG